MVTTHTPEGVSISHSPTCRCGDPQCPNTAKKHAAELVAKGRVAAHLLDQYTFHIDMAKRYERDGDTNLAAVAWKMTGYYHALWEVAQDGLVELRTKLGYK